MNSITRAVDKGTELIFRRGNKQAIVEWKSVCAFEDIFIQRHICEAIPNSAIHSFLQAIDQKEALADSEDFLLMQKHPESCVLVFQRTFLSPTSVALTPEQQAEFKQLLIDIAAST